MSPEIVLLTYCIALAECMAGILYNSAIVLVNFLDWKRGNKLTQCDKILTVTAFNNIFMQLYMNSCTLVLLICPDLVQENTPFAIFSSFQLFHVIYSFWLTLCLCAYYCLSIVSFKHRLFLRMKLKISTVVPSLLLVSAVGSFVFSILCSFSIRVKNLKGMENITSSSSTFFHNLVVEISPVFRLLITVLGFCLPFCLAAVSVALTLSSLWTHAWRMKQNEASFSFARVAAHVRAARIMILLLFLYAVFCIAQVILMSISWAVQTIWEVMLFLLALIYPTAQSRALIFGNSKLRRAHAKACHCFILRTWRKETE